MKTAWRIFVLLAVLPAVSAFLSCAQADDDDNDDSGDDDNDNDDNNDNDDDDNDNDDNDNDDNDDNDNDDDNPYESMIPSGLELDRVLGISSHISQSTGPSQTRDFELEKLAEAGVGTLRTDFTWSSLEPQDNVWTPDGADTMLDLAVAAGIDVLAILDYGVGWAMPGGSHDEIQPAVFADYAGYVAAHFGGRLRHYEVWNEPNISRFWAPRPNPEHYGLLLQAASEAVRANDPDAVVLFGGQSSFDGYVFGPDGLWNFLVRVHSFHPNVCDWFDVFAIHPYTFAQHTQPETEFTVFGWTWPDLTGMIQHARDLLTQVGCPDREIWLTETGWPDLLLGQGRQAAYLSRSLLLSMASGVQRWMWYTFWDGDGSARPPTEDTFGLFSWPDQLAKPSYDALLSAHNIAGNMRYAGDLGDAMGWKGRDNRALVFTDGLGLWAVALWKETPVMWNTGQVTAPSPQGVTGWRLLDQFGEVISQGADDQPVAVTTGMEVVYLTFEWEG